MAYDSKSSLANETGYANSGMGYASPGVGRTGRDSLKYDPASRGFRPIETGFERPLIAGNEAIYARVRDSGQLVARMAQASGYGPKPLDLHLSYDEKKQGGKAYAFADVPKLSMEEFKRTVGHYFNN